MSLLAGALKSGAGSIAGAVSEKLGIDPSMAQNLVDGALPGDPAAQESAADAQDDDANADQDQTESADQPEAEEEPEQGSGDQSEAASDQAEAVPAIEDSGLIGKVGEMLGGTQGIADKAEQLLDQDGDGNPLNDVTGMIGKFFSKD